MNNTYMKRLNTIKALSDTLFFYCQKSTEYESNNHDYGVLEGIGEDIRLRPLEMHILVEIVSTEGISSYELADIFHRTRGCISQKIKVLMEHNLIVKQTSEDNYKISKLYPTPKGRLVSACHDKLDFEFCMGLLDSLNRFSDEDLTKCTEIVSLIGDYLGTRK